MACSIITTPTRRHKLQVVASMIGCRGGAVVLRKSCVEGKGGKGRVCGSGEVRVGMHTTMALWMG